MTLQELIKKYPDVKNKSRVILGAARHFTHIKSDKKVLIKYNLVKNNYILYVGTIEPRKNLSSLLKAFHQAVVHKPDNLKLVLVGKIDWHAQQMFNTIQRLNLHRYIQLLGYVPDSDLPALYQNCYFFTYIPFYEGFGLPVIEAISGGKACLVSNTSSLPEVVGPCGILVNPTQVDEIAKAINNLWFNQNFRQKFEQQTSAWVKKFSWEKSAQQLLQIIENV